jgi:hypothetical protein
MRPTKRNRGPACARWKLEARSTYNAGSPADAPRRCDRRGKSSCLLIPSLPLSGFDWLFATRAGGPVWLPRHIRLNVLKKLLPWSVSPIGWIAHAEAWV